jgi:LmbE family N-acetylglucosaminyl deacetylase
MDPIVIVSPHLDDAVLSCGQLMAGRPDAVVVTIFAGAPPDDGWLKDYDRKCGFRTSHEAVLARREEDVRALARLHALPRHLDFLDNQYAGLRSGLVDVVAEAVLAEIERVSPQYVLGPLGIAHPDHRAVSLATMRAAVAWGGEFCVYEELPGRVLWPEEVEERKPMLFDSWPRVAYLGSGDIEVKERALMEYASQRGQLAALGNGTGWNASLCSERFWTVA